MIFKNAYVYDEKQSFIKKALFTHESSIVNKEQHSSCDHIFDLADHWLIPGLCDIHLHGAVGGDFSDADPACVKKILRYEAQEGISNVCAATMTLPEEQIKKIMRIISDYKVSDDEASLAGIYMEGPFIAASKCGAQDPAYIKDPDLNFLKRCNELSGHKIKFVTVAPEIATACDFIKEASKQMRVCIAHTNCNYEQAAEAFRHGAMQLTHAFNAMPAFLSRSPGPLAAGFDYAAAAELICDGVHLHEATVRSAFKLFGLDQILMISDSMRACGLGDGEYTLGGQKVKVSGPKALLCEGLGNGTIAGSVTSLFSAMRHAVLHMRIPLSEAITAAAVNPRKALGIYPKYGILNQGSEASFTICGKWLDIKAVILRGRIIWGEEFLKEHLIRRNVACS